MNPLILQLFQRAIPYAIAASIGFAVAFYVQGLRVTALKNDVKTEQQRYKDRDQAIIAQQQDEKAKHQKLNEETSNDWIKNLNALHECYRSGRCGVRPGAGGMPSGGLSAPSGKPDAAGTNAVPAPDRVAADCAETTLNLNMLQSWNEKVSK